MLAVFLPKPRKTISDIWPDNKNTRPGCLKLGAYHSDDTGMSAWVKTFCPGCCVVEGDYNPQLDDKHAGPVPKREHLPCYCGTCLDCPGLTGLVY